MIFGMAPTSFNRVCVRSIGWKIERLKSWMSREELFDDLGSMNSCTIPDQFDISWNLSANLAEKIDHKRSIEVLIGRKHLKQKSFPLCFRRNCNRSNRGDFVSTIPSWKDRGFASRCQRSAPSWHQLKAYLIKKDQGCFIRLGFFLISGSSSESQVLAFSGLRSRAIFSGRWNDQPNFSVTRR